jgi:2C-methyl-D-erythritol 2,4-cyclodiphosphate synthase
MNTVVKKIVKEIETKRKNCCFEVINLDDKLVIFANKGSIEEIKEELNKELKEKINCTLETVNIATAYVVPFCKAKNAI